VNFARGEKKKENSSRSEEERVADEFGVEDEVGVEERRVQCDSAHRAVTIWTLASRAEHRAMRIAENVYKVTRWHH